MLLRLRLYLEASSSERSSVKVAVLAVVSSIGPFESSFGLTDLLAQYAVALSLFRI